MIGVFFSIQGNCGFPGLHNPFLGAVSEVVDRAGVVCRRKIGFAFNLLIGDDFLILHLHLIKAVKHYASVSKAVRPFVDGFNLVGYHASVFQAVEPVGLIVIICLGINVFAGNGFKPSYCQPALAGIFVVGILWSCNGSIGVRGIVPLVFGIAVL